MRYRKCPHCGATGISGVMSGGTVIAWPKPAGTALGQPRRIKRPCDWGLELAIRGLETQLGSIEAYNRLVAAAECLRAQIDAGHALAQNPLYAVDIRGGRPS